MKKRIALFIALATILMAALLMVSGCGSGNEGNGDEKQYTLTFDIAEDGKSASIIATDADEGDFAMGGMLIIGENEKVVSRPALNEGTVTIELIASEDLGLEEDADVEDIENAGQAPASYTITAEEVNTVEVTPTPGEYYLKVTTGKGADGAVTLSVDPIQ